MGGKPENVDYTEAGSRALAGEVIKAIEMARANLGHRILDATVANILNAHGIEPVPDRRRQSTWKTFLEAHWDVLASVDFTTIGVWTRNGLVTYYLLFFI